MSYTELKNSRNALLNTWQRDLKRLFLVLALAKENGLDFDWVLKADAETVDSELTKRHKTHIVVIKNPTKLWTPTEGSEP